VLVLANVTVEQCLTVSNATFPNGISNYIRFGFTQLSGYLSGKDNLTTSGLNDLTSSLSISNYYFMDAIQTWTGEFSQNISDVYTVNTQLCFVLCVLVVLAHIALCECVLFRLLEKDYDFNRKLFESMMPEYVLLN
jgi:hypothetical protein